jgi:hypothetical protein
MNKSYKAMLVGGAIAGSLACVDGAVLGLLFGPDGGAAIRWALNAALAGAVFGAIAGVVISRLVLEPPEKK